MLHHLLENKDKDNIELYGRRLARQDAEQIRRGGV